MKEIVVDGVVYVPKHNNKESEGKKFVIVRTYSAGVHMGWLVRKESTLAGVEVTLENSRRIWKWAGAMTLSDLATNGSANPENCKFPCEVSSVDLLAIEILAVTEQAFDNLTSVPVWKL